MEVNDVWMDDMEVVDGECAEDVTLALMVKKC